MTVWLQVYTKEEQQQGSLSAPSKSPELSRLKAFLVYFAFVSLLIPSTLVWKEWQFLQHFHGQVRLLVVIPTSFPTQEKGDETIFSKAKSDIERLVVQIFNHLNQVTFDDETPERPPPPPPARVQSINTMKDFSGVSQAYNQVGLQFMFPFLPLMSLLA